MSAIDSLGGSSAPATASGFGSLTSAEFLNIMLTELQSQDPLEPQDSQALLDQFSSLYQIESNIKLGDDLNRLVRQSEFASASTLIGNLVSGITLDNRRVADLVLSVSNTAEGPVLNLLDGSRMLFSNVDEIVGPLDLDDSGSGEDPAGTGAPGDDTAATGASPAPSLAASSAGEARVSASGGAGDSADALASSAGGTSVTDRIEQAVAALKRLYP